MTRDSKVDESSAKTFAKAAVRSERALRLGQNFDRPDRLPIAIKPAAKKSAEILGFDYAALSDPAIAGEAREAANRIRQRIQTGILETGRDLIAIKSRLGHGHFTAWLLAEFGMTAKTAQNYMSAAEYAANKSEMISLLPPTSIYLLAAASTPEAARTKIMENVAAGRKMTVASVKGIVSEARSEAANDARAVEHKVHSARERNNPPAPREHSKVDSSAREKPETAAKDAVDFLKDRLGADITEFAGLLKKADLRRFLAALNHAVEGGAP